MVINELPMSEEDKKFLSGPTIKKYKKTLKKCIGMYYYNMDDREMETIINYSIMKRYKKSMAKIDNSYTKKQANMTLLQVSDYILSREPIVTAFGTMFRKKGEVPNPMATVIQSFLDLRTEHKNTMLSFPKGSEEFEKYNLLQVLDKIDANGIYGVLGMYTSLLYNINVATSITSQGRALVSSMTLCFEQFLANNVKFGSLNEVVEFINHIVEDKRFRKYDDFQILDKENQYITPEKCFTKVMMSCGYRWIPTDDEMDIIWKIICNLSTEDRNRVYYKNNLYEFVSNSKVLNIVKDILRNLDRPIMAPQDIMKGPFDNKVKNGVRLLTDLMKEYVYYRYMIIDRIDRCDNMIKSVTMVSDTDSTIVSVDAWYRFIVEQINGEELKIANYCPNPIMFINKNEDGEWESTDWRGCIDFEPKKLDYNFQTDEIVEREHTNRPDELTPNDNVRYSIINIMAYILDAVVNDYMEETCKNNHTLYPKEDDFELNTPSIYISPRVNFDSIDLEKVLPDLVTRTHSYDHKCKIFAKTEFYFLRLMMTMVKKNYASLIAVQEGKIVPEDKQLDVKGIECLTKSTKSEKTREALKKILLEDILKAPAINQLKFAKDIIIFEKQIIETIKQGSKEYYKPVTVKSASAYADPMRIQGIKASIAWNSVVKGTDLPQLNLDERNPIFVAKVDINMESIEKIRDSYPVIYENMKQALKSEDFGYTEKTTAKGDLKIVYGDIKAIAIPYNENVPEWLLEFVDYTALVNDNIGGFPYESIGIERLKKGSNLNYTNIIKL